MLNDSLPKTKSWSRLDNAGKIFPATMEKTDTRVFRFYCELNEEVIPEVLQSAVEYTLEYFPNFKMIMRKGVFWYYLEESDLVPKVTLENTSVCSAIYDDNRRNLLFNVTYYHNRINLEVYHVITDGTGALQFLKNLVSNYIVSAHTDEFKDTLPIIDDYSTTERNADSFRKYYQKNKKSKKISLKRAYNLKMEHNGYETIQIIEGIVSTKQVIQLAHKYNTTLTVYLTAIFIEAIHKEMTIQQTKHPVVIMVPVNLRKYFPSATARNFFGMIQISYDFRTRDGSLEDIISEVNRLFKQELTKERLVIRMNDCAELEHNPLVKIVPRPIKNVVLRFSRHINDLRQTAVISNIGKVTMPTEIEDYINSFGVLISTLRLELCVCSYKDNLQIGFASSFVSTDIQKNFFRTLSSNGVEVQIRTNDYYA